MPRLSELRGINISDLPINRKPEWDVRSGLPEPGLGHVAPEEWLPTGMGTKLASLAGKGALMMGSLLAEPLEGLP